MNEQEKQIMKVLTIKCVFGILAAMLFSADARAQILKPGELIYSRASTAPNGSCDTGAVWAVGQDGSNDRYITLGFHPRISPDGRYLMFKRFDPSSLCAPFNIGFKLWIRDLATRRETQISEQARGSVGYFFSPETNRGANQIINNELNALCLMNSDGTNRVCTLIPNLDPIRGAGHMSVRGTDNLLVVQNFLDNADGGLYTLDYDTLQNRQKIPNTVGRDLNPSWSNDGQKIAFAAYPTTRAEPYFFTNLFKINADGSNRTQLTNITQPFGEGFSYSLVWTENNSTIINAAKINGVAGIYKIAADGSGTITQIPITPGAAPEWVGGIAPVYSEQQTTSMGGGVTSGGNYTLVDTVGQAFAGQNSKGGSYNLQSGFWADVPSASAPYDFDGDGKTEVGIFRPSDGSWWYVRSSDTTYRVFSFGSATDMIVPGDFTGDGKADIAVFRASTGFWFIQRNEDNSFFSFPFGAAGDIPAPSDYDGDGKTDAAVFRPSTATWFILNSGGSGTGIVNFGTSEDKPVPADFDGDGKADIAIFRPSDGSWWYVRSSDSQFRVFRFGVGTDKPVPGDYTGDGKADISVFRPTTGEWFIQRSEDNSYFSFVWGASGDVPVPGDYDGDGKFDTSVFRPSNSTWFMNQTTAGVGIVTFGVSGDKPVPSAFVP